MLICFWVFIVIPTHSQDKPKEEGLKKVALSHMDAGRYGEAIDLLNKFVSANPRLPEGYNLRGLCFEQRAQYQNAVLDFRRAIRLDPNYREASENLRRTQEIWYAQLRTKIQGHHREIAIDPSNPYNYLEIGKSYRWLEEWALAEEWYDKYLERDDNASPDEIIRYTEILAKTKHIQKGEKILEEYVRRYPDDWRLWSRYGYFTMWLGKYKNAERAFLEALSFKPFFKEAQDGLDQATKKAYLTQQDPRAFEKEYPIDRYYRLLRRNPNDADSRFNLVDELIKTQRMEEAFQQLQLLSIDHSDDPRFDERYDYVSNFREEVYQNRIVDYTARIEENPKDKIAVQRLAEHYGYLEQYDNAFEVLDNYLQEVPDESDKNIRYLYARMATWNHNFDLSIEIIDELLVDNPNDLDYQLFRSQLGIWSNRDVEISRDYLQNVIESRPNNIEAIIAMGSLMLLDQEFDSAQTYADRAALVDPLNNDVITLQTNIDFQRMRAEQERQFEILQQGRDLVLEGDCEGAIPYYEDYLFQAEPNRLIIKEYGDVLFCAERFDEALSAYDEALAEGYLYEATLQRAKLYYNIGDSLNALSEFKFLVEQEPEDFESKLYLGDSYAKMGINDSANAVYDSLLTWDLDSTQIQMVNQRQEWVPPSGLSGILKRFPSSIGIAPALSFYSDNISFKLSKIGARLDLGIASFLGFGVSFFRSYTQSDKNSLDSATVHIVDSLTNYTSDYKRNFTTFKGHVFLRFSERLNIGIGAGTLNSDAENLGVETEVFATYKHNDIFEITGTYLNSDGALVLYSPYLIDLKIKDERIFASLFKLQGKYHQPEKWQITGYFQYITASDNNEGNDLQLRAGKYFEQNLIAGYEYFYSNYKYVDTAAPFYYSPGGFESHSLWADFIVEKSEEADIMLGGKLGYVPASDFILLEGHVNGYYKFSDNFQVSGTISLGSTSRDNASYRYFSGGLSAFLSL
ncbi:tetratricopeptide repeat protein [Bacteroidota bacterium]